MELEAEAQAEFEKLKAEKLKREEKRQVKEREEILIEEQRDQFFQKRAKIHIEHVHAKDFEQIFHKIPSHHKSIPPFKFLR